jgi:glycosyltransferase involved in cell wall biosynthesis
MTKRNIVFISYDGMTDPLGQSQVLPYVSELSKIGYKFHLISCEKKGNFEKHSTTIQNICDNSQITWHPLDFQHGLPVISSMQNVKLIRKKLLEIKKFHGIDMIHARSYVPAIQALYFKKKHQVPFLFDMRGFWPDERVDGKIWNLKIPVFKWVYKYFKKKEIQFLEAADQIVSLTEAGKSEMLSWKHINRDLSIIEVIPCCADLNFFSPKNINTELQHQFKEELKIKDDDFVLNYLGSIGSWYMLTEMLSFFKVLKKNKGNAKFLFITKDSPDYINNEAKRLGIDTNDIIIKPSERADLPSLISLSDISIFFILPAYSKKASSPTKQAELLGLGIPIICNDNVGDTGSIIRDNKAGLVVNEFTDDNFQKVMDKIKEIQSIDKTLLIETAKSYASLEIGFKKYANLYEQIFKYHLKS